MSFILFALSFPVCRGEPVHSSLRCAATSAIFFDSASVGITTFIKCNK